MTIFGLFDIAMLAVILICAFDALRQVTPAREPFRALAFVLVTVGAFGWIACDLRGLPVHWWALSLHLGFAIYAALLFRTRNFNRRKSDSSSRDPGLSRLLPPTVPPPKG